MNVATAAFQDFANGAFADGLRKLDADPQWQDASNTLDGPFDLRLPGLPGWGEALLLASLLKRYAIPAGRQIEAYANAQVISILKDDAAFNLHPIGDKDERPTASRSPLAILRHALTGTLLNADFAPFNAGVSDPLRVAARPCVGLAWQSVSNGRAITEKSVPHERFLEIVEGLDAEVISFQRQVQFVHRTHIIEKFGERSSFLSDEALDADDQTSIVQQVRRLDCMVTISTTSAHIAACLGVPVVLIAARRKGRQWFWQAQKDHGKHLYPTARLILGDLGGSAHWWESCIAPAKEAVRVRLNATSGER